MNWLELFVATVSASIVGSIHCVGMCGPFTMIATHTPGIQGGAKPSGDSINFAPRGYITRYLSSLRLVAYHLGRLSTYLVLGIIAGLAGTIVNQAGVKVGWSGIAAVLVGLSMIIFGFARLAMMMQATQSVRHSASMERWTKRILSVGKRFQSTSPIQKAFVLGLITTWLPCGWLYLFALAASSTGSVGRATWMMFAFWIGTLPLLSLLAIGSESLRNRNVFSNLAKVPVLGLVFRVPLQAVVAFLMIGFGGYTIAFRSQISLDGMISPIHAGELNQATIAALGDVALPCCKERIERKTKDALPAGEAIDSHPVSIETEDSQSSQSLSEDSAQPNSSSKERR
jgi:uncharacterized protein